MSGSRDEAPTTYDGLRTAIQHRYDALANGQRRIADIVLNDPDGTAFRSIRETAELAQVHQSSVVRFAAIFGLNGYPALVTLCREHLTEQAHLVSRLSRVEETASTDGLRRSTLEHEQRNLDATFARIPADDWERTVRLLTDAELVHVMGLRKCLPVAQLMTYLLRLVRPGVHQVAPVTGALVDELRDLRADDVFVAISIDRYTADTVHAFEEAARRKLHTIAFTDSQSSPLARLADITFVVDCEGTGILRSVTSFIAVVQALATGVALNNGTRSRAELRQDDRLLGEFSIYSD